ncbi:asparagine synthase (glutamine-hydrolyzing), partial [Myxococcota bacterium]
MCGIAGFSCGSLGEPPSPQQLDTVRRALRHRGPDASGTWRSNDGRAALVHTRLAIIDLTPSGAQPMHFSGGRYHMVFNGEIYNYLELRETLESHGHAFVGSSDTEVLLTLFALKGPSCLDDLDGMYAFAVYDSLEHTLFLARDPLGEKPLYYLSRPGFFAFSSEVRALVQAGLASTTPDPKGIAFLFRQGSVPPPYTHLRDVRSLEPAHWIRVNASAHIETRRRYWQIPFLSEQDGLHDREQAAERLHHVLLESVRRRARADVPIAAMLSGGVDSGAVCAFLMEAGVSDLRTFTVTLPGQATDEARLARATAEHLGTRHTEIPLMLDAQTQWVEEALAAMDVPSIDGPNTWLVSRAIAEAGLKVACSGLGGDELFFGYSNFQTVPKASRVCRLLGPLRHARCLTKRVARRLPAAGRVSRGVEALLAGGTVAALWFARRGLLSHAELRDVLESSIWSEAADVDPVERLEALGCPQGLSVERQVSFYELSAYMHDQLLRDTDTMSMAHSLEIRVPLIGRRVVETVASFSTEVLAGDEPKSLLRGLVAGRLPHSVLNGAKRGFGLNWQNILAGFPTLQPDRLPLGIS